MIRFNGNPAPVIRSMQFHYCTVSNPGTGADDAFVLKLGVWRNATWPSHNRPVRAIFKSVSLLPDILTACLVYLLFVYLVLFMH